MRSVQVVTRKDLSDWTESIGKVPTGRENVGRRGVVRKCGERKVLGCIGPNGNEDLYVWSQDGVPPREKVNDAMKR